MFLRYPEKPNRQFPSSFPKLEKQGWWIATQKIDGWRCFITRDSSAQVIDGFGHKSWGVGKNDEYFFLSRRDMVDGGPTRLPISDDVIGAVEALDLPDMTMLDTEWMRMRSIGECPEHIELLGPLWVDNKWQGKVPYEERHQFLQDSFVSCDLMRIPKHVTENYEEFYEAQKDVPYTEGVVLTHKAATIRGNRNKCTKGNMIVKIKWRDGSDGRDVYKEPKRK